MATMTTLNYSFVFNFEKNFVVHNKHKWMVDNWFTAFLGISSIYLILIYVGQEYMKNRPPFSLRPVLTLWNFVLAVFSTCGALRTIPEFLLVVKKHGFRGTLCMDDYIFVPSVLSCWNWLFVMSKIVELGDTAFIILRKQKLVFLHWYHHITAILGFWYSYVTSHGVGRWPVIMNYLVHAFMYTYYFLRAMRFKVPRLIAMSITSMQISQMVIGGVVTIWGYVIHVIEGSCSVTLSNSSLCFFIYFTDFVLFVHFFKNSYFKSNKLSKQL